MDLPLPTSETIAADCGCASSTDWFAHEEETLDRQALELERSKNLNQTFPVALVHDYITQMGGAERVLLSLHLAFPEAPIFTSLYDPDSTFPEFKDMDIRVSSLNNSKTLRQSHRLSFPLLARSFSRMEISADVVICSSSGWAHGVNASGAKFVYCYSPARWLYKPGHYFQNRSTSMKIPKATSVRGALARWPVRFLGPYLRNWDRRAAKSADRYYTTSTVISQEIRNQYEIDPTLLPPPPYLTAEGPTQKPSAEIRGGYYLIVSRLLPYKNVAPVASMFAKHRDSRLIVVGDGPMWNQLHQRAPSNVQYIRNVSDPELRWLYRECTALIAPANEDYGLTPLEAATFGKPTLALHGGGYLDTIVAGVTGLFFADLEEETIWRTIESLKRNPLSSQAIAAHAETYSQSNFIETLRRDVNAYLVG